LGQATFFDPREFFGNSFLDGLATVGEDLFLNQLIEPIQGGLI